MQEIYTYKIKWISMLWIFKRYKISHYAGNWTVFQIIIGLYWRPVTSLSGDRDWSGTGLAKKKILFIFVLSWIVEFRFWFNMIVSTKCFQVREKCISQMFNFRFIEFIKTINLS